MKEELKGAVFSLGPVASTDRHGYNISTIIDPKHLELVATLFHLAGDRPDKMVDIYAVAEAIGVKSPAIRKRAEAMVKQGLFTEGVVRLNKATRSVKQYQLSSMEKETTGAGRGVISRVRSPLKQLGLVSGEVVALDDYLNQGPVVDDFFCGILYGAMRVGRHDKRAVVAVNIKWGREPVHVVATADSETGICYVRDIRYAMGVLATVKQITRERQEKRLPHRNHFLVSILDLLAFAGLANEGGNRRTVYAALLRLEGTKFTFEDPISKALSEKFGDDIWSRHGFRLFSGLGAYGHREQAEGKVPDAFVVSLDNVVYERIINQVTRSLFQVSTDLPKASDDLSYAINLWCRRMVRHGNNRNFFTFDYFVKAVLPQINIKVARRLVSEYLLDHQYEEPSLTIDEGEGEGEENRSVAKAEKGVITSLVYGYIIRQYTNHIYIVPDPNDEIVGFNSIHNQLIKQKQTSASDEEDV